MNGAPSTIVVGHPATLSLAEVLGAVQQIAQADTPIILQTFPSNRVAIGVIAGEIGLSIAQQIAGLIAALHASKTPDGAASAQLPLSPAPVQVTSTGPGGTALKPAGGEV